MGILELGHQVLGFGRVDRHGCAGHAGRNKDEATKAGWVLEDRIERDPSALRASHKDRGLAVRGGVHHRHQVGDGGEVLSFGAGLATPPPVVGDGLAAGADAIQLRAPHAAVANAGVQEDDGIPGAHDLCGQHGTAGCNLTGEAHGASCAAGCGRTREQGESQAELPVLPVRQGLDTAGSVYRPLANRQPSQGWSLRQPSKHRASQPVHKEPNEAAPPSLRQGVCDAPRGHPG